MSRENTSSSIAFLNYNWEDVITNSPPYLAVYRSFTIRIFSLGYSNQARQKHSPRADTTIPNPNNPTQERSISWLTETETIPIRITYYCQTTGASVFHHLNLFPPTKNSTSCKNKSPKQTLRCMGEGDKKQFTYQRIIEWRKQRRICMSSRGNSKRNRSFTDNRRKRSRNRYNRGCNLCRKMKLHPYR